MRRAEKWTVCLVSPRLELSAKFITNKEQQQQQQHLAAAAVVVVVARSPQRRRCRLCSLSFR